jgi:2-keto-4-pentenoate hydratase/2-oxohepta-3-ene-1,7-dioic acid hydratase in catechol pathway
MKIAVFSKDGQRAVGVVRDGSLAVVAQGDAVGPALLKLYAGGTAERQRWEDAADTADVHPVDGLRLEPPVPDNRGAIICVGKNYYAHAKEFFDSGFDSSAKEEVPSNPVIFAKAGSCVVGPEVAINSALDSTGTVDYEGELAIIIGRKAHKVSKADAYGCIFGYTICNDVTSRELQKRHNQWLIGKSLDTFGPLGPVVVTADEMGDITGHELVTTVNGEVRQQAKIADLIFDIPTLIETITATMTLHPGDIIATGTPAGVGIGFNPPKYLAPGDRVEVTISGIGTLSNPVV